MRTTAVALLFTFVLAGFSTDSRAQSSPPSVDPSSLYTPPPAAAPPPLYRRPTDYHAPLARSAAPTDAQVRAALATAAPTAPIVRSTAPPPDMSAPYGPRPVATSAPAVKNGSYWGPAPPAAPKRRPSALRRFYQWVVGPDDTVSKEEGLKVYRDPSTGRTNTLGSKPWMEPKS